MALIRIFPAACTNVFGLKRRFGRVPAFPPDIEPERGRLVALTPGLRMPGSWGYVMRIQANRPMEASLPTLVEFLAEEGRRAPAW